jgi:hypothetical protein
VTAEEAFAKSAYGTKPFVNPQTVIQWAGNHGFLDGAMLTDVMDAMIKNGFQQGSQLYNDGQYSSVDYSTENILQTAIGVGPVKIGISSASLPSGAGNQQGWYAVGSARGGQTDHCVSLCGCGSAQYLYGALGVQLPGALTPNQMGYLLYTWGTIGFVDHEWIMSATSEAWVRNPTTIGVPPLPDPTPPTPVPPSPPPVPFPPLPPLPPVPPGPTPTPTPTPPAPTPANLLQLLIQVLLYLLPLLAQVSQQVFDKDE